MNADEKVSGFFPEMKSVFANEEVSIAIRPVRGEISVRRKTSLSGAPRRKPGTDAVATTQSTVTGRDGRIARVPDDRPGAPMRPEIRSATAAPEVATAEADRAVDRVRLSQGEFRHRGRRHARLTWQQPDRIENNRPRLASLLIFDRFRLSRGSSPNLIIQARSHVIESPSEVDRKKPGNRR